MNDEQRFIEIRLQCTARARSLVICKRAKFGRKPERSVFSFSCWILWRRWPHLHRDFELVESFRRTLPGTGEWGSFFLFSRDGHRNMFAADKLVVCRIEAAPSGARKVYLRPGMGRAVLSVSKLDISSDKSRAQSPVPCGLHHKDCEVATRPAAFL